MSPGPPTIIHSVPQDVNAYNISLFPQDLLKLYHPELTLQLVSHAPTPIIKDDPYFKDWVYFAQAAGLFKINPSLKQPLLKAMMDSHLVIKPSTFPLALIKGKQTIAVSQLMDYLVQIGCNTIRLQVYGQKRRLLTLKSNIGNLNHPLAHLNTFDLGTMYDDPRITLVQPVQYSYPKMTLYPMLLPIAMGYGSVHMNIALGKGEMYQVKAYPRLVHCIKAESGNQALWAPDTVRRARVRHTNLKNQVKAMEITPRSMMGGLRLEVTVTAPTLMLAKDIIHKTPLLNLDAYLYDKLEIMHLYQLRITTITKADYLANLKHLLTKAETVRAFIGRDESKLHGNKKQIILDLFNALGWNTRRLKTTAFNAADAWWLDEEDQEQPAAALVQEPEPTHLTLNHIKGVPAMKALFTALRKQLQCHACPDPGYTYTWDGQARQFQIKCSVCGRKLNQSQAREHILQLITQDELILPEEFLPAPPESTRSPSPAEPMTTVEHLPTPEAPAATTTMQLRSKMVQDPTPAMEMFLEIPWVPMLNTIVPMHGMVEVPRLPRVKRSTTIKPDGNCLFRAVSYHVYGTEDHHMEVRTDAVEWLHSQPYLVATFAAEGSGHLGPGAWLDQMAKEGTWGDELALLGLAEAHHCSLWVYSDQHDLHTTYPGGASGPYQGLIHLGGNHYEILSL